MSHGRPRELSLARLLSIPLLVLAFCAPLAAATPGSALTTPSPAAAEHRGGPATGPADRSHVTDPTCGTTRRGLPLCGAYVGAAHGSNEVATEIESQAGRVVGIRRTYWRADQVDSAVAVARADLAAGRLPWISFKPPLSWEAMAAGQGDAWAIDLATKLAALDGPVWLAVHHEPEGDGNIAAWRAMQERLGPLFRSRAPKVAWTVILTGWNQLYGSSAYSFDRIWPRTTVDVAGFDVYNEYGVTKNGTTSYKFLDIERQYFLAFEKFAAKYRTRWALAETGFTDAASAVAPTWIHDTEERLVAHGGVALTYFDTALNAYGSWALTPAAKRADFVRALLSSHAPLPRTGARRRR